MSKEKIITIVAGIAAVGTIAYFTILAPDREVDISTQNQNVNLEEIVAEDEVNKASDYVLVYDPVAKEYKKLKLSVLTFKDEEKADTGGDEGEEPEGENTDSPTPVVPNNIGDVVTPDELANLSTSDLTDVSDNTPSEGQVLVWDVGANQWKPATLNIPEGGTLDEQAVHVDEAGEIAALTEKGTPAGTDFILIEDSEDSDTKKKIQISNLPTGSSISDIDDLGDVDTSTSAPTNGQVLVWDLVNSEWVPGDLPASGATSANELSDVDTATIPPTAGQVLVWDDGASEWVPGDLPSAGASAIDDLSDVDTSSVSPTDGQSLVWNNSTGEWQPQTIVSDTGVDTDALHQNTSGEVNSLTEKATPVDGDVLLIEDSADSYNKKRLKISNLKTEILSNIVIDNLTDVDTSSSAPTDGQSLVWNASNSAWEPATITSDTGVDTSAIHDNVSGEISVITEKATPVAGDFLLIEDSEASNAKKKVQVGNLPTGATTADELSDVDTSSVAPTDGQALVWDNSGSKWVPGDLPSGGFENPMTSPDDLIVGLQSDEDNFATVPNGATVSSYGEWAGNLDDYAIDENDGTAWQASDNDVIGSWIIVDLGAARNVYQVHILQSFSTSNQNAASHHWTLEYSEDGAGWTQIVDRNYGGHPASMDDVVDFTPTFARYWRMTNVAEIPENWGWALRTLDLIGTTSAGDPGTPVRLAVGTAGQVLKVNPDDGHIAWLDNDIDGLSDVDTSSVAPTDGQSLVWNASTSKWEPATVSSGASLTVEESDSSPSVGTVDKLIFPADSVTDNSDGSVSISFPSASGGVTVSELDGDPSVSDAGEIKFDGATVTDNADGTVTVSITGDGTGDPFPSWQDWTPNFVVGGTSVPLSASTRARYLHIGTTVFVSADIIPASGSYSGVFEIRNFPKPFAGTFGDRFSGVMARFVNQGSGFYDLVIERSNATTIIFNSVNAYQNYNSTINASDGDLLTFQMMYETTEDSGWTGGAASVIDDLSDVDTSSVAPTDGQSLVWNDSSSTWEPGTVSGVDTSAIHDNVSGEISVITEKATPVAGDFLLIEDSEASNAKKRIQVGSLPTGATSADELSDVDTSSTPPTAGQSLVWDDTSSKWVPGDVSATGVVYGGVKLRRTNPQNISSGAYATIDWEVEEWDTDNYWDAGSPGTINIVESGKYLINARMGMAVPDGQRAILSAIVNGSSVLSVTSLSGSTEAQYTILTEILDLNAGDVINIQALQNTGSTVQINNLTSVSVTQLAGLVGGGVSAVDDLTDVDTSSVAPTDGQALVWDDVNSKWIPGDMSSGGGDATSIRGITITESAATPSDGDILAYANSGLLFGADTLDGAPVDDGTSSSSYTVHGSDYVFTFSGRLAIKEMNPYLYNNNTLTLGIYPDGGGGLLYSETFSVTAGQNNLVLSEPFEVTSGTRYYFRFDFTSGMKRVKASSNSGTYFTAYGDHEGNPLHKTQFTFAEILGNDEAWHTVSNDIDRLSDVDTSSVVPIDGQSLVWNDANSAWEPGTPAATDTSALHDNVSGEISLITEKATPVNADLLVIEDSADSNSKKRIQIGSLPFATAIDDLSDVDTSSVAPTDGQSLIWNATDSEWQSGNAILPGATVYISSAISIPNSTPTILNFDAESYDDLDFHSLVTNTSRLSVSDNGRYRLTLSGIFASNANGYRQIALLKNGAYEWTNVESAVNGTATSVGFEYILELIAGDYLELRITQNSGGSLDLAGARFGIERVR